LNVVKREQNEGCLFDFVGEHRERSRRMWVTVFCRFGTLIALGLFLGILATGAESGELEASTLRPKHFTFRPEGNWALT
jgi:hypothetical protein